MRLIDAEDESAASSLYCAMFEDYGTEWIAYRRKPEEASISSDEGPKPQRDNETWKDFLSHRFERKE